MFVAPSPKTYIHKLFRHNSNLTWVLLDVICYCLILGYRDRDVLRLEDSRSTKRRNKVPNTPKVKQSNVLISLLLSSAIWILIEVITLSRPASLTATTSETSFIKKLKSSGRSLVVFYGSQTGTGEEFAGRLAKEGIRYKMKGMVADPEECDMVSLSLYVYKAIVIQDIP